MDIEVLHRDLLDRFEKLPNKDELASIIDKKFIDFKNDLMLEIKEIKEALNLAKK